MDKFKEMEYIMQRRMREKRITIQHMVDDLHLSRYVVSKAVVMDGKVQDLIKVYNYIMKSDVKDKLKTGRGHKKVKK